MRHGVDLDVFRAKLSDAAGDDTIACLLLAIAERLEAQTTEFRLLAEVRLSLPRPDSSRCPFCDGRRDFRSGSCLNASCRAYGIPARDAETYCGPLPCPTCGNQDPDREGRERRCRSCGCTDADCSGCIEKTGEPCYWVAFDLCSACVGPDPRSSDCWNCGVHLGDDRPAADRCPWCDAPQEPAG